MSSTSDLHPPLTLEDIADVPLIPWSALDHEYHTDWWDGPLTGVCSFAGRRFSYNTVALDLISPAGHDVRAFALFELTPEFAVWMDYWHTLFIEMVERRDKHRDIRKVDWYYAERRNALALAPKISINQLRFRVYY